MIDADNAELTAEDLTYAMQACHYWADAINGTLSSTKALAYSSIARQDMADTEQKLRLAAAKLQVRLEDASS